METSTTSKNSARHFASAPRTSRAKRLLRDAVAASDVAAVSKRLQRSNTAVRNWLTGTRPNLATVEIIESTYGNTPALDAVREIVRKPRAVRKPRVTRRRVRTANEPAPIQQTGTSLKDILGGFSARLSAIESRLSRIENGEISLTL